MSGDAAELEVDGIHCFRVGDGGLSFQYVPGEPSPAPDPAGQPTISLWMIPPQPMLQLSTRWQVGDDQLQKLRNAIHERNPGADPNAVQLSLAPLSVERVVVSMGDGAGEMNEVASATSSGFPPFQTVFSLRIDQDHAAWAASALAGARSQLQVSYHAEYQRPVGAAVGIAGDVSDDLAALGPDATEEDAAARVDVAITAGRLVLTRSASRSVPDIVWSQLEQQLRTRAASDLLELARHAAAGSLQDSVTTLYQEPVAVVRTTDVGGWFPPGDGSAHIHVLGTAESTGP